MIWVIYAKEAWFEPSAKKFEKADGSIFFLI